MGTRSGDLDPGMVFHLLRNAAWTRTTSTSCSTAGPGMLGLSGVNDFRDLHQLIAEGDAADAALALDVYCHRVRKYVGAYHAVLGGADVIAFTAGVGENDGRRPGEDPGGSRAARHLGRSRRAMR